MLVQFYVSNSYWKLLLTILFINSIHLVQSTSVYTNIPLSASWLQNATTVAGQANGANGSSITYLSNPEGITISGDDILYIADSDNSRVVMVNLISTDINIIGSGQGSNITQFYEPTDVFITETSLYVVDRSNMRVQEWSKNGTNPSTVLAQLPGYADVQFIDRYGNLYLNLFHNNTVVKCTQNSSTCVIIAGSGNANSDSNSLDGPVGVYVDDNLTLYIADRYNHRIQMWKFGDTSGSTVAGNGTSGPSLEQLSQPVALALDTNGYIYITDSGNNRIVRWAPDSASGVCIVGCSGYYGIGTDQLNWPNSLAFDSSGSLYVTDNNNNRIQKFQIFVNQSDVISTIETTTTTTTTDSTTTTTTTTDSTTTTTTTTTAAIATTTTAETAAISSLQLVDTSQISSTINLIPTSQFSRISSTMARTNNDQQTSENTDIFSPSIQSTTSEQTSISTSRSLIDLLSLQSTISSTINSSSTLINQFNCSSAIISLSPNNPSITIPFQIERSGGVSISSTLQLRCAQSPGVVEQWSILQCLDSSCSSKKSLTFSSVRMTEGELFIPSNTLEYGIYQMILMVEMSISSQFNSSALSYIQIIPSPIEVKLIQFGPSIIIRGEEETLILDPGRFSIDPDQSSFNSSNWNYTYYCGIYHQETFLNMNETMLSLDDPTTASSNSSCFKNSTGNETLWKYSSNSSRSSLTINQGSLRSNQTYHFKVQLNSISNPSLIYSGDLLLQIEDDISMTIILKCVISTQCIPNNEFNLINPTTQIALTSFCIDNCLNISSTNLNIEWNIYYAILNSTNDFIQWTLLANKTQYNNTGIFGINSTNLTVTKDVLSMYSTIEYWRFEVIYSIGSLTSIGLINLMMNSPPRNGTCSISPLTGTITTFFTIICSNWFDENGIKDYSFYSWTGNRSNRLMIGYTTSTPFQIRMPIKNLNASSIDFLVSIRDQYDCTTEFDFPSITMVLDTNNTLSLLTAIESAVINSDYSNLMNSNPLIGSLYSGNQNDVCQVLTSFSQVLNLFAQQNLQIAIQNNISPLSISVSSLYEDASELNNQSEGFNLTEYNQKLNTLATVQEYLMIFINNLTISQSNSVLLQGSTLSQMTSSTNQLTRNALIIASTECLQLSNTLFNNAENLPYEDVQLAATFIAQCASNTLTAVNAPLQGRTIVLDLDTTRANAFPTDYDTDLESPWSNPNLFADGDDFSEETIDKNRNIYYQKQLAEIIKEQFDETMTMITNALNIHLNIEQINSINTSSIIMTLKKMSPNSISNQRIDLNDQTQIWLANDLYFNSTISLRCIQTPLSIAGNLGEGNLNLSTLLSITFVNENNEEIPMNTTEEKSIEFFIPRDKSFVISSMVLQNVSSIPNEPSINNRQFNLHWINITETNPNISFSVHLEMHSLDDNLGYMLIYKFDQIPQLNHSIQHIDGWTIFCPENFTDGNLFSYFIDNPKTFGHQSTIFGIRELNSTEFQMYCQENLTDLLITDELFNFSSNYELRIYTSGCYYLDSNLNWQSDGLLVGSLTTPNRTQCFSKHLTSFASGVFVLPNPINWNYVFANSSFLRNKTIYLTVIIILIIFLVIGIYARYLDKKDHQKLELTVLSTNQSNEKYFYQMIVFTGIWKNSGTNAKVHFVLAGENSETDVRTLTNPHQKILQRGSIDSFIFGVPKSLGLLNLIRIWHDNSGKDSSWFLKYVIVRDLQTMEKFYFLSQQWLANDKGDKKMERVLPVSNEDQIREFNHPLSEKAYYKLSDGHLWFSIFSQPPVTKFTRLQRCICCFVLLFTVMLLSILYYNQSEEANAERRVGGLLFGPFYFTPAQIGIGFLVDVIIFIPSTLLVAFFRCIRQHRSSEPVAPVMEALSKLRPHPTTVQTPRGINIQKKKKKRRILFPWWCLFLAYGLSFLLIGIAILFIIARGIEFGEVKVEKWLASLLTAFFSSVLLSQPIKVLCTAMFFAIMHRRPSDDDDDESNQYIDENEEFYLNGDAEHIQSIQDNVPIIDIRSMRMKHLSKRKKAERRAIRAREMQMWSYIRHLLFYSCYLCILYIVSYDNRNPNSYQQVYHLRHFFLNPNNSTYNYVKMSTIDDFWKWLENSFVENIRAQSWYNGHAPRYLSGFINDKTNRLIGWPVMRQVRIKTNSTCRVPKLIRSLIPKCKGDYSSSNEDHQSWFPGWSSTSNGSVSYSQSIENAFIYRSGAELDSYKYRGLLCTYDDGGYVYEFRGHLNEMQDHLTELRQLSWIDSQTRAIIIEITLYNANVQLFTSVTFLIEFFSTGGTFPQSNFQPIDLHNQFQGFSSILHSIFALIYMLLIVYFTLTEIHSLMKLKKKYFYSIWSFIQWGTIISSWTGLGIYIWRFLEGSRLNEILHHTNGYQYLNIQLAVDVDEILSVLLGFCCFFSTLKYLYLLRFNYHLSQFGKTLQYAQKALLCFAWTFVLVFIAFISLFYLLFYSKLASTSDVYRTAEMLFEMLLLKLSTQDLYEADAFLGPLAFTLFIYFVVFICCTMTISIINDAFRHIRAEKKSTPNEDVISFVFIKMKRVLGIKENDQGECQENKPPLEKLSDKIDQLVITLNKLNIISSKKPKLTTVPSTTASKDLVVEDI